MALVLGFTKGESFFVGSTKVTVTEIYSDDHFVLDLEDGTLFDVTDDKMVQILPEVFVSVGARYEDDDCRIAIEAPKEIVILRESLVAANGS